MDTSKLWHDSEFWYYDDFCLYIRVDIDIDTVIFVLYAIQDKVQ